MGEAIYGYVLMRHRDMI